MNKQKTLDYGAMLDKDLLIYFPVKVVPAITGFAAILILTHNMMPVEYGIYSVVMATVLLMNQMFGSWLSNAVLYVYPDHQNKNDHEFKLLTIRLQGISALVAVTIGYTAIILITHNNFLGLIGAFLILTQLFQSLMMTFLQSSRRVAGQAVSVIVQSLSQLLVLCVLIYLVKGKEVAAVSAVLAGSIASISVLLFKTGILSGEKSTSNNMAVGEVFRKLLRYGMPMCAWFFATQFYTIGDRILLKLLDSTSELGQYASFRDLATGCAGLLTMPLLMASHPIIMSMWKSNVDRSVIEQLMTRNLAILTILFVPIFVVIDLCGPELLVGLLGERYLLDRLTMILVVGSIFLGCLTMYVQKGLEVTGKTLQLAIVAIAAAVISFVGNMLVIPSYGVAGAAMIVVLVQGLYLLFVWYLVRNILNPTIPLLLFVKLAIWVISVETACRMLGSFSGELGLFWSSSLFRLIFVLVATFALYATNHEILSIYNRLLHSLRKLFAHNSR